MNIVCLTFYTLYYFLDAFNIKRALTTLAMVLDLRKLCLKYFPRYFGSIVLLGTHILKLYETVSLSFSVKYCKFSLLICKIVLIGFLDVWSARG